MRIIIITGKNGKRKDGTKVTEYESDDGDKIWVDADGKKYPDMVLECTVKVQTISGRIGTKVFENRAQALKWLNENSAKIQRAALVEKVLTESTPPGMEDWVKSNKKKFKDEYGDKKGMEVLYATAWKMHNKGKK